LLQACLGISFHPEERSVTFNKPTLPEFLNEVTLHNLMPGLGPDKISVVLRRVGTEVAMNVIARSGDVHVLMRS